ncbi:MAG: hypothetical protein AB7G21_00675 [Dehalococcoidia bacterium]
MTDHTPPASDAEQPREVLACADCGHLLGTDPRGLPWDDRWPCPRCHSLRRTYVAAPQRG